MCCCFRQKNFENEFKIYFSKGRYSPVRRASEGCKSQFQGPLQECQYLQKGITQRNLLAVSSPPLMDNSCSLPGKYLNIFLKYFKCITNHLGSPIHMKRITSGYYTPQRTAGAAGSMAGHDVEVSQDMVLSLIPTLEQLIKENIITTEAANNITQTRIIPFNIASFMGLIAHSMSAQKLPTLVDNPPVTSPTVCSGSTSPMHLITKGISGLSTGNSVGMGVSPRGGSITRGTSAGLSLFRFFLISS